MSAPRSHGLSGAAPSLEQVRDALEGRYRVARELARTATGPMYLAYEGRRERPVMIRVLAPHLAANPATRAAFVRAAKAAAREFSVLVVRIRRVDDAGAIVYAAMDYVGWQTLAQRVVRAGPMTVGQATRMLYDVSRAVDGLHVEWKDGGFVSTGMIHGGLSPDNILVAANAARAMVVIDPGAACVEAGSDADHAAYRAARAPFMSAELVQGAPADARCDVYALGVTAYYAVTGRLPFEGRTADEIFIKHLTDPAPQFLLYNEHGDTTFAWVVRTCLAKDPARRFQNAFELTRVLERAPEIRGPRVPRDVETFAFHLVLLVEGLSSSPLLAAAVLLFTVTAAAAGEWQAVALGGLILAWMPANWIDTVLAGTRAVLAKGYSRADMVDALRVQAERERGSGASFYLRDEPWPPRRIRRVIYGTVGLLAVALTSPLAGPWPPDVGWFAIALGIVAALALGGSPIDDLRDSSYRIAKLWVAVWHNRVGDWIMRLAGWRLERPASPPADAIEIRKLHEPSFEYLRDVESTRDLVNLAPAMLRGLEARINEIRACLNATEVVGAADSSETPPLDEQVRQALEKCLELLTLVWRRLDGWRLGDNQAVLVAEFKAAAEACEAADGLLDAAGYLGRRRDDMPASSP